MRFVPILNKDRLIDRPVFNAQRLLSRRNLTLPDSHRRVAPRELACPIQFAVASLITGAKIPMLSHNLESWVTLSTAAGEQGPCKRNAAP
jgi:hypothetical protein